MDAGYPDKHVLLGNRRAHNGSLLRSLEQAARCIGFYVKSDKTEFMCFKQYGAIFSLNSKPLKLVNQFIYLGSNISSIESDVNISIEKV